jgi:hypothetical protein
MTAVRAVLQVQKRQKSKGVLDVEQIAELSRMYTKPDRILAIKNAFKDAIEANESRHNALSLISTFQLLAAHDQRQSCRATMARDQFLNRIHRKDLTSTSIRQIFKTPSLRKAFSKTLSERKCEVGNEQYEYKLDASREPKVTARKILSLHICTSKHAFIDSDEATELTTASCSTIDCF